jgi:hypothetical protein
MNKDDPQRGLNAMPSAGWLQERGSAAWFDGQYCSPEAFIGSLIYRRNTVQNGSLSHFCSALELSNSEQTQGATRA